MISTDAGDGGDGGGDGRLAAIAAPGPADSIPVAAVDRDEEEAEEVEGLGRGWLGPVRLSVITIGCPGLRKRRATSRPSDTRPPRLSLRREGKGGKDKAEEVSEGKQGIREQRSTLWLPGAEEQARHLQGHPLTPGHPNCPCVPISQS